MSWAAAGQQTFNRSYTYDGVNRLATMSAPGSTCSGLSWSYDQWGNRAAQTVTGGTCGSSQLTFNSSNHVTNSGFQYDAAGNMTHDASHSYTYDAENRVTQVDGGTTATYVYDGVGSRIEKIVGGTTIEYAHDVAGNVMDELSSTCSYCRTTDYNVVNGQVESIYTNNTTYFVSADHLGSTRLLTNVSGGVVDSMDYLPFGEQIAGVSSTTHKFTGYERDSESGLDNAQARYNSSSLGRFMSPDPVGNFVADATNPQTWNLYAYVNNNPLAFIDPSGMVVHGINEPLGAGNNNVGDIGTGCVSDGIESSCSMDQQLIGAGAAYECPYNDCQQFTLKVNPTGQSYWEFSVPCPPGLAAPCADTGVLPIVDQLVSLQAQSQPPIWWLQTKVFVSSLGSNFVSEFTPRGCFAQFANELATGQVDNGPPGYGPEDVTRSSGDAAAGAYAASRALSYPLKSSVYRGILGMTETAAGVLTLAPLDYEAGKAFVHEMKSLRAGTCR